MVTKEDLSQQHALRIKGGVAHDSDSGRYLGIVSIWRNSTGEGEPDWVVSDGHTFASQDDAWAHYSEHIRPKLQDWVSKMCSNGATAHDFSIPSWSKEVRGEPSKN